LSAPEAQAAHLLVDSGCRLGEGIVWDERRQALFWTDILSSELWMHVPGTGATRRYDLPDMLGCIALCDDGRLLLALAKRLYLADPDAGETLALQPLQEIEPGLGRDTRSNDGRCDRDGNFVFGTKSELPDESPIGAFYQFSSRHGLRPLALPAVAIPNSICFSRDGRTLYFCDSSQPRILQCDYASADARVSKPRVFAELPDGATPDGSTLDADGRLWNAHWDRGRVVRHAADGRIEREVAIPAGRPTCCAIGGARLDTLYVTTAHDDADGTGTQAVPGAGGVHAFELHASAGLPEPRFDTRGFAPP
jgi:L-arabinonolactonase